MDKSLAQGAVALVSAVGILYSGYLTYISLATGVGACETFYFGFPSCFYGFLLYALVFVSGFAVLLLSKSVRAIAIVVLSVAGVGFAAFLTGYVLSMTSCARLEIFGMPPCVMGLGMFTLVFILAVSLFRS